MVLNFPFDSSDILRRKKSIIRQLREQTDLTHKRIAILSGSTIGDIRDFLELFLLSFGVKPQFFVGQYNRFYEDIMFNNEELIRFDPEIILIHTTVRNLSDSALWDKLQAVWNKIKSEPTQGFDVQTSQVFQ